VEPATFQGAHFSVHGPGAVFSFNPKLQLKFNLSYRVRHKFCDYFLNKLDQNLSKIMKICFTPYYLKGNPKQCMKFFRVLYWAQYYKKEKIIFLLKTCTFLWLGNSVKTGNLTYVCDFLIPRLFFPPLMNKLYWAMLVAVIFINGM